MKREAVVKVGAFLIASAGYFAAFFLPTYNYENHSHSGAEAFKVGLDVIIALALRGGDWTGFLLGWLPNPLFGVGMLLLAVDRPWAAGLLGLVGLLCGLWWLTWREVGLEGGYYAWLFSMAMLSLASLTVALDRKGILQPD